MERLGQDLLRLFQDRDSRGPKHLHHLLHHASMNKLGSLDCLAHVCLAVPANGVGQLDKNITVVVICSRDPTSAPFDRCQWPSPK